MFFTKKLLQIANRHMKRCSTSLIIREMKIKTTVKYQLTPVRIAIIKNPTNNKCWWGYGENGIQMYCWWNYKLMQQLRKKSMGVPQKSKNRITISSVQSLSHVWLFATPWIAARQASLSITNLFLHF